MYKKYTHGIGIPKQVYRKIWLIMRLTTIILLVTLIQVSAATRAQNVTLKKKDASLKSIFKEVKKQTGYMVLYPSALVNNTKPVTVNLSNTPLKDAMDRILENQNLDFEIQDNSIIVRQKASAPAEPKKAAPAAIDVSGKVTDEQGQPLPGATVKVKDGKSATTTDARGEFTLKQIDPSATLVITFIGYQPKEVKAAENLGVIQLAVATSSLDQVQVIAYGQTSQRLSTGNVTTIKAADIEKQPVNNPLLALQGRVPGLFIEQASGVAGGGVKVRIQGQNSYLNGNDPLYVIDGVPYSSQLLSNLGGILRSSGSGDINANGNPLSFINPADIESISVLKDADATAIYGSRAANGAILITTKKGKPGATQVNFNLQTGWGKVTRKLPVLNAQQYLQMRHEAIANDNGTVGNGIGGDYDLTLWDTTRHTDWQKELIGRTSQYNDMQVSLSGGSENTQYTIGSTFHRETTVFPGEFSDKKGSLHFNLRATSANRKFSITLSGNYMIDNNHLPNEDLTNAAISLAPIAPRPFNDDGTLNWQVNSSGSSTWTNPLKYTFEKYSNKTTNLVSNIFMNYSITAGLDFSTSFGYTNLQSDEANALPITARLPEEIPYSTPSASFGHNNINSWIIEPQLNFKRSFGKGRLEALLGTSIQQNNSRGQILSGTGFPSDLVLGDIRSAARVTVNSTAHTVYRYNALFGRINYNLSDKYIVNFTARRDGSSRFGPENQFHNFASLAGAWVFSNENFIQQNLSFLSFGKLRASYGTTGSDQISDYRFLNLYEPINSDLPYLGGTGLQPNGLVNPYLQWEETKKLQFGLDLGFLKDRILLNANYFRNRSSNQLLPYELPTITGFATIDRNFPATIQNTGWEITLNTINVKSSNFNWSTSANITMPKNKLVSFPNFKESPYVNDLAIGKSINIIKTYRFLGVDPTTGIYSFMDSKGNPTSTPVLPDDKTVIIDTSPKYYGGIINNFQFRGVELNFLLQFVKQVAQNYYPGGNIMPGWFNGGQGNAPLYVLDRWQKPGDITTIQRYTQTFATYSAYAAAKESDAAYRDASYIRLKNVSLSYRLPLNFQQKLHLQNAKIFLQGQNLLTFSSYKGLDPETKSSTSLPPIRVLTLGVQITL
ncbi:SusC/RagA family TonB-linked outer membrane protein [Mucilaginibacter sp. R-33]|uniref:SusC/RagA family TonB-linked outer membrane protein n=1 Tax=Mucilaginibacter sp. R-33 TaxID=3416711 RepID=UPI003CEDC29C